MEECFRRPFFIPNFASSARGNDGEWQAIFDLLTQRTHSEGRGGENEHEFHKLHELKLITMKIASEMVANDYGIKVKKC